MYRLPFGSCTHTAAIVGLGILLAGPSAADTLRLAAMGDSMTDEYAPYSYGGAPNFDRNWVEQLRAARPGQVTILDNALAGAESDTLLSQGQHTLSANQLSNGQADAAVLIIGANDFAFDFHQELFFQLQAPAPFASYVLGNIQTAAQTILNTGNTRLIMATIPDFTVTLAFSLDRTPSKAANRANLLSAVESVNQGILNFATTHHLPVVDLFGFTKSLEMNGISINGAALPQNRFFANDGFHPSTALQGMLANLILTGVESQGINVGSLKLTDQEILAAANLPFSGGPTFVDLSPFILNVPEASGLWMLSLVMLTAITVGIVGRRCRLASSQASCVARARAIAWSTVALFGLGSVTAEAQIISGNFAIDSSLSSVAGASTLNFVDFGAVVPLQGQGDVGIGTPGFSNGLAAQLAGNLQIQANLSTGTIQFLSGSSLQFLPSGSWAPLDFGSTGQSPAVLGGFVDIQSSLGVPGTAVAAVRNLQTAFTSGVLGLAPTGPEQYSFGTGETVQISSGLGSFQGLSGLGVALGSTWANLFGSATNGGSGGTLTTPADGAYQLDIPLSFNLSVPIVTDSSVVGTVNIDFGFQGSIHAQFAPAPPPPTLESKVLQDLDGTFTLDANPNIFNSTLIPHTTVFGIGRGQFDYFSFTVASAGSRGIFDIDQTSFDSEIFLFKLNGQFLTGNDDYSPLDPGSSSGLNSYLDYTFLTPGRYVIGVARYDSIGQDGGITGTVPSPGIPYTLHVSLTAPAEVPEGSTLVMTLMGALGVSGILSRRRRMMN